MSKGEVFMLKFGFVFLLVFVVYMISVYIYIFVSSVLKEIPKIKNNYVVKNILLSSKQKIDIFDIIVVFVISYFIYYR